MIYISFEGIIGQTWSQIICGADVARSDNDKLDGSAGC